MDQAALADETGAEYLHDPVGLHEHLPELLRIIPVIGALSDVQRERYLLLHLYGRDPDRHSYPERMQGHTWSRGKNRP